MQKRFSQLQGATVDQAAMDYPRACVVMIGISNMEMTCVHTWRAVCPVTEICRTYINLQSSYKKFTLVPVNVFPSYV